MSIKGKARKARREAMQEKQAKQVIKWICGALIVFAIVFYAVYLITQM